MADFTFQFLNAKPSLYFTAIFIKNIFSLLHLSDLYKSHCEFSLWEILNFSVVF